MRFIKPEKTYEIYKLSDNYKLPNKTYETLYTKNKLVTQNIDINPDSFLYGLNSDFKNFSATVQTNSDISERSFYFDMVLDYTDALNKQIVNQCIITCPSPSSDSDYNLNYLSVACLTLQDSFPKPVIETVHGDFKGEKMVGYGSTYGNTFITIEAIQFFNTGLDCKGFNITKAITENGMNLTIYPPNGGYGSAILGVYK